MTNRQRLLSYFKRHKKQLIIGALCVVASVFFSLLKPLIIRDAVNDLSTGIATRTLWRFGLLLVVASAFEDVFLYLQRWIVIGASRRIEYDMRNDFYGHLQKLQLRFYHQNRTGDLMSRATNDLSSVRMLVGPAVMHAFASSLVVIGSFIMMLRIDRTLALVSLIAVPVVAGAVKSFGEKIHDRFKMVQDHFGDISSRVQENLAGVRVVRAFTREDSELETFKRMNHEYVERNRSLIRLQAVFYPLLHCVIGILFVAVFFIGSRKIIAGTMTLGSFVAFQFYLARMVWPLIALGWVINLFQRGLASMKRLNDVWNVPPDVVPSGGEECSLRGNVEIRNLTFGYDESRKVLSDVSISAPAGRTIGIVGRTGSGKSTLLSLLTRLYEAPHKTIYIDGTAIEDLPLEVLRGSIAIVPQETFLFSESIAENIRFGRADASDDEVRNAAELAGLSGDVISFANGLDTVIGERGITLSGGQKQRTAIARAIVRNPSILLLDDSLSAVDTATEERILRSLREVRRGRTVFVVSHRVSSVKDADEIYVLDEGSVIERGTHEELIMRRGYYAELYRRQTLEEEIEEIA